MYIDFGKVDKGKIIYSENLRVKNKGDEKLIISLETTCDCLKVTSEENEILPENETKIKINLNTGNYNGKIKKYFYLISFRFPIKSGMTKESITYRLFINRIIT